MGALTLPLLRPQRGPDKPVTGRYSAQDIEQQREGAVGDALGEGGSGVGDGDGAN